VHDSSIAVVPGYHDVVVSVLNVNTSQGPYDIIHGCGVFDICFSAGLSEFSKSDFEMHLFPNPAATFFTIFSSRLSLKSISIMDLPGKKVEFIQLSGNRKEAIVDVSGLSTGIYFVKVETENGTSIQKLIKQ